MGRDKAQLVIDGEPLWWRQWKKLRALPCHRLFLSMRAGQSASIPPPPARVIVDALGDCGPLGAIISCLRDIELDGAGALLLVLGIDLPLVPVEFLEDVIFASQPGCGAVARHADIFEPLAAVYPVEMLEVGRHAVRLGHYSMQNFIREGIERSLMIEINAREFPKEIFTNINTPDDFVRLGGQFEPRLPTAPPKSP
jgi:molybdopterin-guanine dinucleotide biosynthesis protein A